MKLIKIISLALFCLISLHTYADANQQNELNYWPHKIAHLEAQHQKNPQDQQIIDNLAESYSSYGILLMQNNNFVAAADYCKKAVNLKPDSKKFRMNLSNVYVTQGRKAFHKNADFAADNNSAAKNFANLAIEVDPSNGAAYTLLSDIEYANKNVPAAEEVWKRYIEAQMVTVPNEHFDIKTDPDVAKDPAINFDDIFDYVYKNVSGDFQFVQSGKAPVVIYTGGEFNVAVDNDFPVCVIPGAYNGKIRLDFSTGPSAYSLIRYRSIACHEYTHYIIDMMTNGNCPRWLNEGLAQYEEFRHGQPPFVYSLAGAYKKNELISWDKINDALNEKDMRDVAYQQSYSFVYFLVKKYGMDKIINMLKALGTGKDIEVAFKEVYGMPLAAVQSDWQQGLNRFFYEYTGGEIGTYDPSFAPSK